MPTDKQREANRINAQRSTGPRTREGKEASRLNAIKHGCRANGLEVLPNEDPKAFAERVGDWMTEYLPTGMAMAQLVRHAANLSWKIDRIARYETAFHSRRVRDAMKLFAKARADRLEQAARHLLPSAREVEQSGYEGAIASELLDVVRSSAEGCRGLIARWRKLRDAVKPDGFWIPEFEMHAVRLSGRGSGPLYEPELLDMIVANRVLQSPEMPIDPFRRLDGPLGIAISQGEARDACLRQPVDPCVASAVLTAYADRAIAGLEALLEIRERDGDADSGNAADEAELAAFDPGPEGERLRRYQFALSREFMRTVELIARLKLQESKLEREEARGESIGANEARSSDADPDEGLTPPARPDPAPNEANSSPGVQVSFTPGSERPVEPVRPALPEAGNRASRRRRKSLNRRLGVA